MGLLEAMLVKVLLLILQRDIFFKTESSFVHKITPSSQSINSISYKDRS